MLENALFVAVPVALFVLTVMTVFVWSAPVTYDDCDLCGRRASVKNRHAGKAACDKLCNDCYRSESRAWKAEKLRNKQIYRSYKS